MDRPILRAVIAALAAVALLVAVLGVVLVTRPPMQCEVGVLADGGIAGSKGNRVVTMRCDDGYEWQFLHDRRGPDEKHRQWLKDNGYVFYIG